MCDFIESNEPHVVFLQEVIQATERTIIDRLGSTYMYFCAGVEFRYYFVAILVRRTPKLIMTANLQVVAFPDSEMGRHVIKASVSFYGVQFELFTSHLESLEENEEERIKQLSTVFKWIAWNQEENASKICIFGGDLNITDQEFNMVGLPPHTADVWEACGSQEESKFTWDMSENDNREWSYPPGLKLRLDRLYLSSRDGSVSAKSFRLVGKDRLPRCKRFPSDHWGLWTEFCVAVCSKQ